MAKNTINVSTALKPQADKLLFLLDTLSVASNVKIINNAGKVYREKVLVGIKPYWQTLPGSSKTAINGFVKELKRLVEEAAIQQFCNDNGLKVSPENTEDIGEPV